MEKQKNLSVFSYFCLHFHSKWNLYNHKKGHMFLNFTICLKLKTFNVLNILKVVVDSHPLPTPSPTNLDKGGGEGGIFFICDTTSNGFCTWQWCGVVCKLLLVVAKYDCIFPWHQCHSNNACTFTCCHNAYNLPRQSNACTLYCSNTRAIKTMFLHRLFC